MFVLDYVPVPDNDLGPVDGGDEVFDGFGSNIETHPTLWNSLFNGGLTDLGISCELGAGDEIWSNNNTWSQWSVAQWLA